MADFDGSVSRIDVSSFDRMQVHDASLVGDRWWRDASKSEQALPDRGNTLIARTTVEILNLRPSMSYGLSPARD
jgi:hypothetical protein